MEVAQKLRFDECHVEDDELNITSSSGYDPEDIQEYTTDFGCHPRVQPRKLSFTMDISDSESNANDRPMIVVTDESNLEKSGLESTGESLPKPMVYSPPYKRVRALRLFDSPATPKTLMEKSAMHTPLPGNKGCRLFPDKPRPMPVSFHQRIDKPAANVNPFTPNGMMLTARKRTRSKRNLVEISPEAQSPKFNLNDSDDSETEVEQPMKRVALQESNIPRYHLEFHELGIIGTGVFGTVYKCINRMDGCIYAIKKSNKPVAGCVNEKAALNEVWAHAVLQKHPHVVSYYSAWAEENHMVIQMEYCNGGSLADVITHIQGEGKHFSEAELRRILLHVAEGLRYIHSKALVHLDIKPENIFISREKRLASLNYDSADDGFDEEETEEEEITYKIGDLGHVTTVRDPQYEEGDCRYLAREIMNDPSHLSKADIFSLGLTVYEAGGGGPLPKNGEVWRAIREDGKLNELALYSRELNDLLRLMIHPNPEMRPSAATLIKHRVLCPFDNKSNAQLRRELNAAKLQNEVLSRKLQEADKCLKAIAPNMAAIISSGDKSRSTAVRSSSRIIGKQVNRSSSTTNF